VKVRRLRRSLSPRRSINILLFALWVAVFATIGGTKAFAGTIELAMRATGAVSGEIQSRRDLDDSHFCALLGPAGKEQTFELSFNKRQTDTFVVAADFGLSLSASGIVGRPWDETQPSAILQVAIGNRRFVGLLGVDPSFHLRVAVDPGDGTGTFSANHLVELPEGATIDIEGSWRCVPNQVTAHAGSSGSRTEGPHLAALGSAVTRPAALPRPHAKKASAPSPPISFGLRPLTAGHLTW